MINESFRAFFLVLVIKYDLAIRNLLNIELFDFFFLKIILKDRKLI